METIDFRSDTVTQPTKSMRQAIFDAKVGDDVCGEDPTVNELQDYAANLLGKEAALFVPSGTMSNQCAILAQTQSGNEVLLADQCHIVQHEAGAAAFLARAQLRTLSIGHTHLKASDLSGAIRPRGVKDIHYPKSALICVEQATSSGTVIPLSELEKIHGIAKSHNIPVHMDGARLFNAATALDIEPKEVTQYAETISICLSKGLCAPVGSLLVGERSVIDRARSFRKILGGGMRQAGILAAAGLVALKEIRLRLHEDHTRAKILAARLKEIPGAIIPIEPQINMVFLSLENFEIDSQKIVDFLQQRGIRCYPAEYGIMRFAIHYYTKDEHIAQLGDALTEILKNSLKTL